MGSGQVLFYPSAYTESQKDQARPPAALSANFHEFVSDKNVTEDAALNAIRAGQLKAVLLTLSAKEREVIGLLYMEGYTATEAGDLLGISKQAVNKRKRAAFEKIRANRRMF